MNTCLLAGKLHYSQKCSVTCQNSISAPSGSVLLPSGSRGPVYWATIILSYQVLNCTSIRLTGTGYSNRVPSMPAVSTCPIADMNPLLHTSCPIEHSAIPQVQYGHSTRSARSRVILSNVTFTFVLSRCSGSILIEKAFVR